MLSRGYLSNLPEEIKEHLSRIDARLDERLESRLREASVDALRVAGPALVRYIRKRFGPG